LQHNRGAKLALTSHCAQISIYEYTAWLIPPLFAAALREKIRNRVTVRSRRLCRMCPHDPAREDAMLMIRIVTAGAVVAIMATGAAAQSAADTSPGKPISLLQILLQPSKAKPKPHVKFAHTRSAKAARRFASRKTHLAARDEPPAESTPAAATVTAPASIWPAVDTSALAAAPAPVAAATPQAQSASGQSALSEMVVGGRTVQIASPNDVNAIDLAADEPREVAATPSGRADRGTNSVVALARQDDGSGQSWMAELLATLGGALAAGSVGWFLIGTAPQRRYG
jgi:hypothetical protein